MPRIEHATSRASHADGQCHARKHARRLLPNVFAAHNTPPRDEHSAESQLVVCVYDSLRASSSPHGCLPCNDDAAVAKLVEHIQRLLCVSIASNVIPPRLECRSSAVASGAINQQLREAVDAINEHFNALSFFFADALPTSHFRKSSLEIALHCARLTLRLASPTHSIPELLHHHVPLFLRLCLRSSCTLDQSTLVVRRLGGALQGDKRGS